MILITKQKLGTTKQKLGNRNAAPTRQSERKKKERKKERQIDRKETKKKPSKQLGSGSMIRAARRVAQLKK